jgi:hypothetical protein
VTLFSNAFLPPVDNANSVIKGIQLDPSVVLGDAVKIIGGIAYPAQADSLENSNVLGVVEQIDGMTGQIRVAGVTLPIYSGLEEDKEYFLSDQIAGGLQDVPPTASGSVLLRIGQPYDEQRLFVLKGERTVRA